MSLICRGLRTSTLISRGLGRSSVARSIALVALYLGAARLGAAWRPVLAAGGEAAAPLALAAAFGGSARVPAGFAAAVAASGRLLAPLALASHLRQGYGGQARRGGRRVLTAGRAGKIEL